MPRWTVIQLITAKELRDLIRDRRTVMLILIMPAVLYPLFGLAGYYFATIILTQPTRFGVFGSEAMTEAVTAGWPALLNGSHFAEGLLEGEVGGIQVRLLSPHGTVEDYLRSREVDAVLEVPPNFSEQLLAHHRPTLVIHGREGDDTSKLAARRLTEIVRRWEARLRQHRFRLAGLPHDYDQILNLVDPQHHKPQAKQAADELRDTFTRVFPFLLMMWLLAGAIQPAVDMTAGEKERGTMETLLISPAERSEIVLGKFLATTAFSFTSVVWNVIWLAGAAFLFEWLLGYGIVQRLGLLGCIILGLPLAMLFSAVCVALGVFAKSTKEGQYYLLPMILIVMPLAFWSMTPGMKLTPGNAWVPVTGAILLQQQFLSIAAEPVSTLQFLLVIAAHMVWISIALVLAVWQFHRESVLFRETGGRSILARLRRTRRWRQTS